MYNHLLTGAIALLLALGGLMGYSLVSNYGSEPLGLAQFKSVQLAPSPISGYILETDGTDNTWVVNSGGGGGGSDNDWQFFNNSGIRLGTTTNQVVIGNTSTSTLAKLELVGSLNVSGQISASSTATSTFANGIQLDAGCLLIDGSCFSGGASALDDLTDVDTTGVAAGNVLAYDGTNWVDMSTTTYILSDEIDTYSELNTIVADATLTHNGLIDTYSELNTIVADVTLTHNGLIDTSSELAGIVTDETGSGALVFGTSPTLTTFFGTPCTGNNFLQDISDTGAFSCAAAAGGSGTGAFSTTTLGGEDVAYYVNDVLIGNSAATGSSPFWFDVSATTSYIGAGGSGTSSITLASITDEDVWIFGTRDADNAFELASSTSLDGASPILSIAKTGTTTASNGFNLTAGCFAINGTCVGGGGSGTVTSVDVSGGTTGLTFSGGPITTSGTITMAGTLAIANGGTGQTSFSNDSVLTVNGAGAFTSSSTISSVFLASEVILSSEIDTYSELNAIVADVTLTHNGLIDTYSELNTIVADVTLTHNGLIDTFSELDAIVADKALINQADTATTLTVTNATTTNLDITSLLTFNGITGSAWTDFCTTITGSADLCDGSDNTGGSPTWGSITGTLSSQTDLQSALNNKLGTSTTLTVGQVPYVTGDNAVTSIATTTITAGTGISSSASHGYLIGGSNTTFAIDFTEFDTDSITQGATNLFNVTHTGEVTGSGALTIADSVAVTSWNLTTPTLTSFFGTPCTGNEFLQDIGDTGTFSCAAASGSGDPFAWTVQTGAVSTSTELWFGAGFVSQASSTVAGALTVTGSLNAVSAIDATTENTIEAAIDTLSNLTTTGALNSGSITTGFGNIDNGSSNITTGGILTLDIDGTAVGAAGSITLGAGNDAAIYFDGTDLQIETNGAGASGIVFNSEDDTYSFEASDVALGDWDTGGFNLVSGDTYQINSTDVLSATTLGSAVVNSSLTSVGTLTALTVSGAGDFSGGSLQIPNAAAPTVDAVGEIAQDTTSDNIVGYDGATTFVVGGATSTLYGWTIASTSPDLQNGGIVNMPSSFLAMTARSMYCKADGGTSVQIFLSDGTNDTNTVTCTTTGAFYTLSTNNTWTAGEDIRFEIGTVTGSPDYLTVGVYGYRSTD